MVVRRTAQDAERKWGESMGAMSRNKGKTGEREWARWCTARGYECHRTAQCRGDTGQAADVEGLPGVHIEVKRTETLRLYEALAQSRRDAIAGDHGLPIVAHRKNDCDWVVIMDAEDWMELYRVWEENR